jgi:membrane protein
VIRSPLRLALAEIRFLVRVILAFDRDGCAQAAGALSYTTVLALVPMVAVMLATLALVPALYDWHMPIEDFIFENFLPTRGVQIRTYVRAFVSQAQTLQFLGLAALAVSAIAMMATIESTFNTIWKVTNHRAWWHRGWLYMAILGVGPLTLTAGIAVTALAASVPMVERYMTRAPFAIALGMVPILASWFAFAVSYKLVPNRPVAWRHALMGGALTAILYAAAKHGFAVYVEYSPQQQTIYGAFAAVPLFLVWVYVSWFVVLFGAVFTHESSQREVSGGSVSP